MWPELVDASSHNRYKYQLYFVVPHCVCPSPKLTGGTNRILLCAAQLILTHTTKYKKWLQKNAVTVTDKKSTEITPYKPTGIFCCLFGRARILPCHYKFEKKILFKSVSMKWILRYGDQNVYRDFFTFVLFFLWTCHLWSMCLIKHLNSCVATCQAEPHWYACSIYMVINQHKHHKQHDLKVQGSK
jgi:hypothetical protein